MSKPPFSVVGPNVISEICEVARMCPPGCFLEVGVYKGGTAWHLNEVAKEQHRVLYLADTFTGIPYHNQAVGDSHIAGDFNDTSLAAVKEAIPEAVFLQGIFPQSAEHLIQAPIAFVHLDCDQYQSYRDAIKFLSPLMAPHGVMWFDDYGCLVGATKAVTEIFGGNIQIAKCGKAMVTFR